MSDINKKKLKFDFLQDLHTGQGNHFSKSYPVNGVLKISLSIRLLQYNIKVFEHSCNLDTLLILK